MFSAIAVCHQVSNLRVSDLFLGKKGSSLCWCPPKVKLICPGRGGDGELPRISHAYYVRPLRKGDRWRDQSRSGRAHAGRPLMRSPAQSLTRSWTCFHSLGERLSLSGHSSPPGGSVWRTVPAGLLATTEDAPVIALKVVMPHHADVARGILASFSWARQTLWGNLCFRVSV